MEICEFPFGSLAMERRPIAASRACRGASRSVGGPSRDRRGASGSVGETLNHLPFVFGVFLYFGWSFLCFSFFGCVFLFCLLVKCVFRLSGRF